MSHSRFAGIALGPKFDNGCKHWLFTDGKAHLGRIVCLYCAADVWMDQTALRTPEPEWKFEHGTLSCYREGCRCEMCVTIGRGDQREIQRVHRQIERQKRELSNDG